MKVKIKVVTKDAAGRSVTKLITLKSGSGPVLASPQPPEPLEPPSDSPVPAGLASLKPITKVSHNLARSELTNYNLK